MTLWVVRGISTKHPLLSIFAIIRAVATRNPLVPAEETSVRYMRTTTTPKTGLPILKIESYKHQHSSRKFSSSAAFYCDHPGRPTFVSMTSNFDLSQFEHYWLEEENVAGLDLTKPWTAPALVQTLREILRAYPPLLNRTFRDVATDANRGGFTVRIMQWNTLSQSLGTGKDNFVRCPPEALSWEFRRLRILEEILLYNPDVLCLQEVDHFNLFHRALRAVGYEGVFFPKPDSPALYVKETSGPDGCALFYKMDRLRLMQHDRIILKEGHKMDTNQVSIFFVLEPVSEAHRQARFCVATTHLKAKKGWEQLRFEQGSYLLKYLQDKAGKKPIFVCGDFNADEKEPVYVAFHASDLNMDSAYKKLSCGEVEPPYTSWKIRGGPNGQTEVCRTVDYIWYSKDKIRVRALLEIPDEEQIGKDRTPSFQYPSDHFSLAADFTLP